MAKWVYLFDEFDKAEKHAEGRKGMRGLLGGKGEWLAEMTRIGVPVSPGFTVTTEACNEYISSGGKFPKDLWNQILKALSQVKKTWTGSLAIRKIHYWCRYVLARPYPCPA